MVALAAKPGEPVGAPALRYINRLSDFLFVAARAANDAGRRRRAVDARREPLSPRTQGALAAASSFRRVDKRSGPQVRSAATSAVGLCARRSRSVLMKTSNPCHAAEFAGAELPSGARRPGRRTAMEERR